HLFRSQGEVPRSLDTRQRRTPDFPSISSIRGSDPCQETSASLLVCHCLSLCLPEFTATIGHAENRLVTPMNRANRSCRQWAYQIHLAMLLVRLTLVASISLAPSVMRESRLTLPQDRLSATTCRPSRPISGCTLSQRIHKKLLVSFVLGDLRQLQSSDLAPWYWGVVDSTEFG